MWICSRASPLSQSPGSPAIAGCAWGGSSPGALLAAPEGAGDGGACPGRCGLRWPCCCGPMEGAPGAHRPLDFGLGFLTSILVPQRNSGRRALAPAWLLPIPSPAERALAHPNLGRALTALPKGALDFQPRRPLCLAPSPAHWALLLGSSGLAASHLNSLGLTRATGPQPWGTWSTFL